MSAPGPLPPTTSLPAWALRLNMEESRLLRLLSGARPDDDERTRLTRMLLTLEPGEARDRILTPLLQPAVTLGPEDDPVAAAVAETTARLGSINPTQVVGDRLWNAAVTEGKDPDAVGRQLGILLRLGKSNQHRQSAVEDPTVVELRELFLARELIATAVLPVARLAQADLAIRQRRTELHQRLAGPVAAELTPQRQLAIALTELRACADLSSDGLEDSLGRDPGWLAGLATIDELSTEDITRLRAFERQDRTSALPAWLRRDFTTALSRAERSASHAALDGERLARSVGQLLAETRTSLRVSQAQAARDLGVERHVLRSRERGTAFRTFRGLRLCLDAAELYRRSPRHGELTEALTQYADLLHTERFLQLRSTRDTTVDDRSLVVSVMMHSLLRELDVSEERFADTLGLDPGDIRDVVRPFQPYATAEWSTLETVRRWLSVGDTRLRGTQPREDDDPGGAVPAESWPAQLAGDVAEFAALRRNLNLSADSRATLRSLMIPETAPPEATVTANPAAGPAVQAEPPREPAPVSESTSAREPAVRKPAGTHASRSRGKARVPEPPPAAPAQQQPSDELWWQVAAVLRARFRLPFHRLEPTDVAGLATDAVPAEALCAVANGEGAALDDARLNALVAESDRRAPGANRLGWTAPFGLVDDPAVVYAHLLRGWAVDRGPDEPSLTPSQFQFAHRELPIRRGGDAEKRRKAALFHVIRGHRGDRDTTQIRLGLTSVMLKHDPEQPLDPAALFTSPRPAGAINESSTTTEMTVDAAQESTAPSPSEGPPDRQPLSFEEEAALLRRASSRTAVWLSEVPIELVSESRLSEITVTGDSVSRERYAARRDAILGRPDQDVTYIIGNPDLLPALDPAAKVANPVDARWHRQTRSWLKRASNVAVTAAPDTPDVSAGLVHDFEVVTDVHGDAHVITFEDGHAALVTDDSQAAEYQRFADSLTAAIANESAPAASTRTTAARKPARRSANPLGDVENLVGLEGQALRDAKLRNWYRRLTGEEHVRVASEMKTAAIKRADRYFRGEDLPEAEFARLRQNLRTAQRRTSPAQLELTARQMEAVFTWARETKDSSAVAAAAVILDAIAEVDHDLTRDILEATVIGEATTEDYAQNITEDLQNLRSRRSTGVKEVDAIIGWFPAADRARIREAVSPATTHVAERRAAEKRAERGSSLRARKRRQVAEALAALGDDVDATDRATVEVLLANPTASMETVGRLLDPPVAGIEVTNRMHTLVTRAGLPMPGAKASGSTPPRRSGTPRRKT